MKSIDVELVKSNMLPMLASQRFYASWKAFIRELVLNAIDACNVRQALEWSWGTEFLEMEQAEQIKTVREPYEPHIIIAYQSFHKKLKNKMSLDRNLTTDRMFIHLRKALKK